MAHNCIIEFDQNEYGTYFTGQQITGKVIIGLNKTKSFKAIKLQINGYAQCQWREKHYRKKPVYQNNLRKKHIFYGHEDYIASTTYLVGSELGQNFSMASGTHTYSFACPIPINCPSSYEGTFGHIRYIVKVTIIRAGSANRTYNKGFTVLKLLDLNRELIFLKSPACNESLESFCFFNSKAVHLRIDVPQTGYVPGQMILVSSHVKNESKADVKKLLITLYLRATYTSDTPCMRTVSEKVCLVEKYCGGPVLHYTTKHFAEIIRVPATPPTCDHLSKNVRISYDLCVTAIMNHFMSNPKTVIPITIGNVPLVSPFEEIDHPQTDEVPTTSTCVLQRAEGDNENILGEETELNYELPPPSYEEAIFMTANIADADGNSITENQQFTPRYPVYNVDNIALSSAIAQSPPPNPPQKRKKPRTKNSAHPQMPYIREKPAIECPREI